MEETNTPLEPAAEPMPQLPERSADEVLQKPQKKKKKWIAVMVLILLLLAAAGAAWLFYANEFILSIVLEGEQEILVEYGESYQEPGAKVVLSGKWLLKDGITPEKVQLQIHTELQEDVLGKYTVDYSAEFYGWSASAQRTVRVVDSVCPVITLKETDTAFLPGEPYVEDGYEAYDNYDGDLTDKVHITEEMGVRTYAVIDSSGNPASAERKIPYFDPIPPQILLEGKENITITTGTVYSEPGYSAKDNVDGDLTAEVVVEGEVIWYKPGVYTVSYTVTDSFYNVTQKVRTVTVEAVPRPQIQNPVGKTIYLTFDDGPGPYTVELLDLLKRHGVKATFFVTNSGSNGELWRMYKEGHSIGIHTMTHDYNSIYASEEVFFNDLYGMQDIIYRETGIRTTLMRFPGGGSNLVSNFNKGIMTTLTEAVQDAGFQYFDWNVDSNDAGGALKRQTVVDNVIEGIQKQRHSIVLQHDIHDFSVEAVEDIILWGLENGYQFLPLTPNSPTMHHDVLN